MRRMGLVVVAAACGGGGHTPDANDPHQQVVSVPTTINRDLDLLFVIDDSASTADKQNNFAVNFPNFINVLSSLDGGLPNLHIGVVTTDVGTGTTSGTAASMVGTPGQGGCAMFGKNGVLQTNGAAVTGNFISDIKLTDGTRQKNYTGNLADVFAQMAKVGSTGCGFEQPLHAMRRALDNNPMNVGFIRPTALLGVVFLTDEDDCTVKDPALFGPESTALGQLTSFRCTRFGVKCSTGGNSDTEMNNVGVKDGCASNEASTMIEAVQPFHDFLVGLKPNPSNVVVAGIIGNPMPVEVELRQINGMNQTALKHSCQYQGAAGPEVADPGVRMKAFFDLFPNRAASSTICQPDLSQSLEELGLLVGRAVGSPCVSAALGPNPDCIVEDVVGVNAMKIPPCGTAPCWRLEVDTQHCTQFDHLKLVVERATAPDPSTVTNMSCIVP